MNKEPVFVDEYLPYLLARAGHIISNEFHAIVETSGVTLMEWRVMASLWGKDFVSVGELAVIVLSKQPTLTKLVIRMEMNGWVKRFAAIQDKRQSLVSLTDIGRAKVEPLIEQARQHEDGWVQRLDQHEMILFKELLSKMIPLKKED